MIKKTKKIKRITSALLVTLLLITVLTGCGVNELGYLSLSNEFSSMAKYNFESEMRIELSEEISGKDINIDLKLKGSANLENLESIYMDLEVLSTINGTKIKNPINFKIVDNKLYAPKSGIAAMLEIMTIIDGIDDYKDYDVYKKIIEEIYNNNLKDVDYILLMDLGDLNMDNLNKGVTYKEVSEQGINYLKKTFNGFDSKIIKKISNGYSIELNSDGVFAFAENLLDYLYKNKVQVFDETIKYIEELYKIINTNEFSEEDKKEIIDELNNSRQDFYDFINTALYYVRSEEFKNELEFIKGSKIKNEIYKDGKSYIEKSNVEIVIDEVKMGKLTSYSKITPANVEKVKLTGNIIDIEKLEELYDKIEDKINPIKKVELIWFPEDIEIQICKTRLYENTDYDFQPYKIIDGRIYLPLRYITESFGEEVEWDGVNRKAYIVRGTDKIDMTGIIVDSKTMIKIRDFEKLGYKIGYEQVDGYSTATIEK